MVAWQRSSSNEDPAFKALAEKKSIIYRQRKRKRERVCVNERERERKEKNKLIIKVITQKLSRFESKTKLPIQLQGDFFTIMSFLSFPSHPRGWF